jgi:general secretion pathway protein G
MLKVVSAWRARNEATSALRLPCARVRFRSETGLTLIELLITVAIIGTLSSIVIPTLTDQVEQDKNKAAMADIAVMSALIDNYIVDHGVPPDSLDQVGFGGKRDPWGRPYEFLNVFNDGPGPPNPRKDHFLVPLNSDYDLYSKGPDGDSKSPLTAKHSRDDIVRANNGGFIGIAADY